MFPRSVNEYLEVTLRTQAEVPQGQISQRRRKEDEAAGQPIEKGHCKIGELTHKTLAVALAFLELFLSSHNCRMLIKYFLPVFERTPKTSFERIGGHWQKLSGSKVSDVADIRETCFEKGNSCPRAALVQSGQRGQLPPCLRCP